MGNILINIIFFMRSFFTSTEIFFAKLKMSNSESITQF